MGTAIEIKIVDMEVTEAEQERYRAAVRRLRQVIKEEFPEITIIYPWEMVEPVDPESAAAAGGEV